MLQGLLYSLATDSNGRVLHNIESFEIDKEFYLNIDGGKIKGITKEIIDE